MIAAIGNLLRHSYDRVDDLITALVMHGDEASAKRHDQMGFEEGWGKALEQLVAVAKQM